MWAVCFLLNADYVKVFAAENKLMSNIQVIHHRSDVIFEDIYMNPTWFRNALLEVPCLDSS